MASVLSESAYLRPGVTTSVKIVVLGAFGVGKTTYVASVSEIAPLATEERMTRAGELVDDLGGMEGKTTTTVAMDFGRLTIASDIVLYLFGAPGQARFAWQMSGLLEGALGGLVLVDTRTPQRLEASFDSIGRLEEAGVPYAVAVNVFDDAPHYDVAVLREALDLEPTTPLVLCDARQRASAKDALISLVTHLLSRSRMESVTR
ncbi:ATP/GTP-binding protein [Streptomyces sp. RFCAC02]|uniref:GTP-binding protein n=1 Tax=Streptomyces sp. RFCAC02 TaxID=2499143 RepID=UPI0010222846|nr:ATP/GTP-binding protein [Streptomyces sp. RFCAC02]